MAIAFGAAGSIISSTSATTLTPVLPSNSIGNGLLVMIAKNSNGSFIIPATGGWQRTIQSGVGGQTFNAALFVTISNGAMANPVFTWATAAACMAQAFNFTGMAGGFGGIGGEGTGTANPHSSSSFASTGVNSLILAVDYQLSATAQTTTPTGWTGLWANGDATSGIAFAGWSKALTAIGSASGAISQDEAAVNWIQHQHELLLDLQAQACI